MSISRCTIEGHEYEKSYSEYVDTITMVDVYHCLICGAEKEEYRDLEPPSDDEEG